MHNLTASYTFSVLTQFPIPIFIAIFTSTLWALDLSFRSYLLKVILDHVANSPQAEIFARLSGPVFLYLLSYFLVITSFRLSGYFVDYAMIPQLRKKIISKAFEMLLEKNHSYYQNNFSGNLSSKVNDLGNNIPELFRIAVERFFPNMLAILIAFVALSKVSPIFALILFIWTFSFIGISWLFSDRLNERGEVWSELTSVIGGKIVDSLSNVLSIRLFAAKKVEQRMIDSALTEAAQAEEKMQLFYFWIWFFYGYSFLFVQILNFYFLCLGRSQGWITIGDFGFVLMITSSIVDFLWQFCQDFTNFSRLYRRSEQALKVILDQSELANKKDAVSLLMSSRVSQEDIQKSKDEQFSKMTRGNITFKEVKFFYEKPISKEDLSSKVSEVVIFENLSVEIKAGQKVGLVGYSGGGKTTFVNLILRLYDVIEGAILIDDRDIRNIAQNFLHKSIAMIPQDPSLFHRSLMENIRYGRIDASDEEVLEAAKKAHAHEFIQNLSEGYHTLVGERGVKLSGGQRQRIAIARAILKNAPILILDEATSQLDSVTENLIQESLLEVINSSPRDFSEQEDSLSSGSSRTTIVIAHRLSTLLHMDRILVFDRGQIVEDGTHGELLAKAGLYKSLWDAQVGGFLADEKAGD